MLCPIHDTRNFFCFLELLTVNGSNADIFLRFRLWMTWFLGYIILLTKFPIFFKQCCGDASVALSETPYVRMTA